MSEKALVKVGKQGRVVIPKAVREKMDIGEEDLVRLKIEKAED